MTDRCAGRRLAATLFAMLLAASPANAADDDVPDFVAKAEALIEPYLESGLFSGTVLVAKDGKPIFRRAYGLANREWNAANTLDTHFRIGSITKPFTAAAILQLAERGKLSLDDRIRTYVPSAPPAWDRVTLRNLLGHTSGIINYTALPDYIAKLSRIERTPQEIVALTEGEPLLFEPGEQFTYSNTNYVLLGMAIEAVSGLPYPRYLHENILGPLGLKDTDYDDASAILPRRAAGYRFGQAHWRNVAPMASSIAYAAGGLYSTVDDLFAFDTALFGARLISPASLAAMTDGGGREYGLGVYVGTVHGRRLWSHGGAVFGFISINDYYPDERLCVIVLANNENAPVQKIARELGALRFGILDPAEPIALEDLIMDRYAGTYQLGPRFFVTIAREGRRLTAKGTGQPAFAALPESDRTFFAPAVDARITFDTEPDGTPNGLVLHQSGIDRIGTRIDAETAARILAAPRPERHAIPVEPAKLVALAGQYGLGRDVVLTIRVEDGRLFAQATGQAPAELFAESEHAFFYKAIDAQIDFETDETGRVSGLVLHQRGLDTPARRLEGDAAASNPLGATVPDR